MDRKTVRRYWRMSEEEYRKRRHSFLCRDKGFATHEAELLETYRENDFERLPMSSVYDYLEELVIDQDSVMVAAENHGDISIRN